MGSDKKIAFQGIRGAYSELACRTAFPHLEVLPCESFPQMLASVRDKRADYAMVPIENSVAGRVADIHDLLPTSGLHIVAEHFQRIEHTLMGLPGTKEQEVQEARSHVQALSQCRQTLENMGIQPTITTDTAGAAREVANTGNASIAAIASEIAAEVYGLEILRRSMEDASHNTTRFVVMSREALRPKPEHPDTITTLVFRVRSVPAALYKALGGFASNGINLSKIESYLIGGSFDAAQFYVDAEGHPEAPAMRLALEELRFFCPEDGVRILGVYPAHAFRRESLSP